MMKIDPEIWASLHCGANVPLKKRWKLAFFPRKKCDLCEITQHSKDWIYWLLLLPKYLP